MMNERIEILIAKYFVNQITNEEVLELRSWIQEGDNNEIYKEYIDINYAIENSKAKTYSYSEYKNLEKLLCSHKRRSIILKSILKYAAIFIGATLITYSFFYKNSQSNIAIDIAPLEQEKVTLVLNDGSVKEINAQEEEKLTNTQGDILGLQVGNEIVYNNKLKEDIPCEKNTLNVPYGQSFKVTLHDGSQVQLNSGSSLTYPQKFAANTPREVYLTGEAYFIVSKDVNRPFIVNSKNLDIKVLGTQFNISAYPDDKTNYVILVEGSLAIEEVDKRGSDTAESFILKPNQKAQLNLNSKPNIEITEVSVAKYIAWKTGELYFQNDPFDKILTKLERKFNIHIENKNKKLGEMCFTGRFNKNNIIEVLNAFQLHTPFSYKVKDNNIIIENS